jgi:hypothetical protein
VQNKGFEMRSYSVCGGGLVGNPLSVGNLRTGEEGKKKALNMGVEEAAKKYKFTRKDFAPLETKPLHFDMVFDMSETKVRRRKK